MLKYITLEFIAHESNLKMIESAWSYKSKVY